MEPARILIVDDQPTFAQGLRALLLAEVTEGAQEIDVATNAYEALEFVENRSPHLVLMDIGLPLTDGIEATKDIKALAPSTIVVMLTASEDPEHLMEAIRAGASGYLLKTLDLHEIATAIESIIHGNVVIPAHLAPGILSSLDRAASGVGSPLTEREREILGLIGRGEPNDRIADALGMTPETVSKSIASIYTKLHVTTRAEAAAEAARRGLT